MITINSNIFIYYHCFFMKQSVIMTIIKLKYTLEVFVTIIHCLNRCFNALSIIWSYVTGYKYRKS
jgi:hypothetical protein